MRGASSCTGYPTARSLYLHISFICPSYILHIYFISQRHAPRRPSRCALAGTAAQQARGAREPLQRATTRRALCDHARSGVSKKPSNNFHKTFIKSSFAAAIVPINTRHRARFCRPQIAKARARAAVARAVRSAVFFHNTFIIPSYVLHKLFIRRLHVVS